MTGSSGNDEPMTAEQKAQLKVRTEPFRQRRQANESMLEPYRSEIESLEKRVNFTLHPESIPR